MCLTLFLMNSGVNIASMTSGSSYSSHSLLTSAKSPLSGVFSYSYWLREVFHTPTCLRYQSACATTRLIRLWCAGVIVIEQDADLISILFYGVYSRRLSNYITYWYKNTIKSSYFPRVIFITIFSAKYRISTRLIIEKPVRRPIVPPTAARMLTNLAASSLVILSNVGVSKKILTKLKLLCSW